MTSEPEGQDFHILIKGSGLKISHIVLFMPNLSTWAKEVLVTLGTN